MLRALRNQANLVQSRECVSRVGSVLTVLSGELGVSVGSLAELTHGRRFLWEAYTNLFGGSFLEQEAFEAKNILALPDGPSLEVR